MGGLVKVSPADLEFGQIPSLMENDMFEIFLNSIAHYGVLVPILLASDARTILDGNQRVTAALRLGIAEIPAIVLNVPKDSPEALGITIMVGALKGTPLVYDLGTHLRWTIDGGFNRSMLPFSDSEIAELMGISNLTWDQYEALKVSTGKKTSKLFDL